MRSSSVLLLLAVAVFAQAPKTGAVEGTVSNSLTGEPLAKAHITLRPQDNYAGPRFGAISTPEGRFSISGIAPGAYVASVERTGYLPAANAAGSTEESLEVKAAETAARLDLKLAPQASITGRVLDESGSPLEHIRVEAMRGSQSRSADTNRRGEFRLGGLRAGRFLLRASPWEGSGPPEIRSDGTRETHYGPAEFPAPVETHAGVETAGIEIRLTASKIVRVSGYLAGAPANAASCGWQYRIGPDFTRRSSHIMSKDPRFTIWRLARGTYQLSAWCQTPDGKPTTPAVELEVGDSDIDNVELRFVPPFEVKGQVDGGLARMVQLQALSGRGIFIGPANVEPDGTFRFASVRADRYRVKAMGASPGVYVKEPAPVLDLTHGVPGTGVRVLLAVTNARLTGVVQNEKGPVAAAMVGMVPDEPFGGDVFRSAVTSADGKYSFDAVPPGKYKVFVFDRADEDTLGNGEAVGWYSKLGETVEIGEGEAATKDLKVPVWDNR